MILCKNCKTQCCDNITLLNEKYKIAKIPKKVKMVDIEGIPLIKKSNGKWKCKYFKKRSGICRIYYFRPTLCRKFKCFKSGKVWNYPNGYLYTNKYYIGMKIVKVDK